MSTSTQNQQVDSVRVKIGQAHVLGVDGVLTGDLHPDLQSRDLIVSLYQSQLFNRLFDEHAVSLQRTGRLGTFASALGQEAVSVGVAAAMQADDLFLPSFREQGGQFVRGVKAEELLAYWGGDERGSDYSEAVHDFPVCIPVGSQYPQAAGAALAFKLRKQDRVAVVFGGDGSTSKGEFYESLNMAGVWDLPLLFVIVNNQWAISTPRTQQTHAGTLAQKSLAGGIPGVQVDGNDVFAVYSVTKDAIDKARKGKGAYLIEAVTYRMSDHTTADDASRYRSEDEVTEHKEGDPLLRVKRYLINTHAWTEDDDKALRKRCEDSIAASVELYLQQDKAPATEIFDYLFEDLPVALHDQRAAVANKSN